MTDVGYQSYNTGYAYSSVGVPQSYQTSTVGQSRLVSAQSTTQSQAVSQTPAPDQASISRLTMAKERVQYLMEEHKWLADKCQEYLGAVKSVDDQVEGLKAELSDIKAVMGKLELPTAPGDLEKYRQTIPTHEEKLELMAIINQQQAVLATLKAKKSKKTREGIEEEPRVLDVGEHKNKKSPKKIESDNLPEDIEMGDFRVPEDEPTEVRDFSTFGEKKKSSSSQPIKRRTLKTTANLNESSKKKPTIK